MSLLAFSEVAGARGGRVLFAGIELTLAPGAAAVVTGPNGSGKTTLLRIAGGLLAPSTGRVARNGAAAWLGDDCALDGERALSAALEQWARIDLAPDATDRVIAALDAMGLAELADVPVRFLSAGQRRRAGLARVIASDAPLWLLDEPATGLDTAAQDRLARAIATHRAGGGAVMLATHQPIAMSGALEVALG